MKKTCYIKSTLLCALLAGIQLFPANWEMISTTQASSGEMTDEDPAKSARAEKTLVQMVRSLQYLHDNVAHGEKGARAKQARLLGDIGRMIAQMPPEFLHEADNLYALVTYLFNGGNPHYVEAIINDIPADIIEQFFLDGALSYAKGDELGLVAALGTVELDQLGWGVWPQDLRLSAYLALASHLALENPKAAQQRLAFVRSVAPGTLFEESALRREVRLAVMLQDSAAMRRIIHVYAKRFSSSPYASDFWREIRLALPMLDSHFDDEELGHLIFLMPKKEQYMLLLRIARTSLLEGRMERTTFAADHALDIARALQIKGQSVPARLYLAATLAATQQAAQAVAMLHNISRQDLPARDRPLFDVVSHIAHMVKPKVGGIDKTAIEKIKAVVGADDAPLHGEIVDFLTRTQEKLGQIDTLLEQ